MHIFNRCVGTVEQCLSPVELATTFKTVADYTNSAHFARSRKFPERSDLLHSWAVSSAPIFANGTDLISVNVDYAWGMAMGATIIVVTLQSGVGSARAGRQQSMNHMYKPEQSVGKVANSPRTLFSDCAGLASEHWRLLIPVNMWQAFFPPVHEAAGIDKDYGLRGNRRWKS